MRVLLIVLVTAFCFTNCASLITAFNRTVLINNHSTSSSFKFTKYSCSVARVTAV